MNYDEIYQNIDVASMLVGITGACASLLVVMLVWNSVEKIMGVFKSEVAMPGTSVGKMSAEEYSSLSAMTFDADPDEDLRGVHVMEEWEYQEMKDENPLQSFTYTDSTGNEVTDNFRNVSAETVTHIVDSRQAIKMN